MGNTVHRSITEMQFSSRKKLKTHVKQRTSRRSNEICYKLKKFDEGTVNRTQAATSMKFVDQFNNCSVNSNRACNSTDMQFFI